MKSLQNFITEAQDDTDIKKVKKEQTEDAKTVVLDFTGINGADDLVKTVDGETGITVDGTKITVDATKDNANDISDVLDTIKKTYIAAKKVEKTTNSESFSAKVKKIGKGLSALYDYVDKVTTDDTDDDE